jgi:hypothetical protein
VPLCVGAQRSSRGAKSALGPEATKKPTDLSHHSQHDLDQAAYPLNTRPQQALEWMTPSDKLAEALR